MTIILESSGMPSDYFRNSADRRGTFSRLDRKTLREKTNQHDSKFADLARRPGSSKLHLIATKLNTRTSEVYSRDTNPKMSVAEAVRRFMSIPLFFNGGLLDNYLVRLFDRAKYVAEQNRPRHTTIPKAYAEAKREKIENFFVYGLTLIQTLMRSQENRHLESGDWHRTVYINTLGVDTTEFDLDHETKRDLEASGRAGTEQYFDWHDANTPENQPLKRPPD